MSDQRWFTWRSGRLSATSISRGWAPTLTARDPSIPNLPLESPAAAPAVTDRALAAAFQTRTTRGRRALSVGWTSALTRQAAAPGVVPAAAWFTAPRERRQTTERVLVAPEPLQWQYIAPPVAAILAPPRPKVIEFRRLLRLTPVHAVYPPPTGPPNPFPAWAAARVRPVSHDRRLQRLVDQPVYPATPAPAITDRSTGAPFETRLLRSRRLARVLDAPVYPQAVTAPVVTVAAFTAPVAIRRASARRLLVLADAPSYPSTPPVTAPATIAAVVGQIRKRRASRPALFLSSGAGILSIPTVATTPAVYPSFLARVLPAVSFKRRFQRELEQPAYPPTPAVTVTDRALADPFQTRTTRSRRRLVPVEVLAVAPAAPPEPSQAPISAVVAARVIRRHGRPALFLSGGVAVDGIPAAQPPAPAWRAPVARRVAFKRRLLRLADPLERPQTPPVPPQPEQAWRSKAVFRASQRRVLQAQAPQITYPETPVAAPGNLPPLVGFVCNTGTLMGRW